MVSWTRRVAAHRKAVLACWLVLFVLGGYAASNLGKLLTNRFSVPGSEAEKGLSILKSRFNERGDGAFTLVARSDRRGHAAPGAPSRQAAERAATKLPGGKALPVRPRRPGRLLRPDPDPAAGRRRQEPHHARCARRSARSPGVQDLSDGLPGAQPTTSSRSTAKTSARARSIAVPIAIAVLLFMFGTLGAVIVPLIFVARDPAHDARAGVGDRPPRQHRPVRDQHRHADRARRSRSTTRCWSCSASARSSSSGKDGTRRARDDHVDGRPRDAVLGPDGGDRARRAAG